ncbi:hypothetical protein L228DRAFT_262733 [Xylona heveae TC161]|uniref:Rad21/Rec8-like protein N-terminal domain-containing protein n=1 Tax=Xylona heveae (strain CBS 132557 / TC161) TaxID=1328760 RepID=A0A165FDH7_XYLHT|nr:hypothetical protein L228DRAFT_262733 [Xylona heveae TC161]KZF20855.1 hypothetical protein L228DRAFT_262733 [Xylona heveae TC161]
MIRALDWTECFTVTRNASVLTTQVLTSRKHGVATVWSADSSRLVATLGSKSVSKKVNRKAILEVNVSKACETILAPEAPMALRLQSHLMYGVSRVYSQQCGYVLADAQNAQNNMRTMFRVFKTAQLDPDAGKARPDQLTLQDDPAFLPDLLLPEFDLDLSRLDITSSLASQSLSSASPHSRLSSQSSIADNGLPALVIPTSDTADVAGGIGGFIHADIIADNIEGRAGRGMDQLSRLDEDTGFLPDVDFEFDAEGNVVELGGGGRASAPQTPQRQRTLAPVSTGASSRVRREHLEGQLQAAQVLGGPMELDYGIQTGDELFLPEDVEPFPPLLTADEAADEAAAEGELNQLQVAEPEEAAAPNARRPSMRRGRQRKAFRMDEAIEIRNAELACWNDEYIPNMAAANTHKQNRRDHVQARLNASFWVFGCGLGGIGHILDLSNTRGSRDLFAGDYLREALLGERSASTSRKRPWERDDETQSEDEHRRSRLRQDIDDQVGRAGEPLLDEDGMLALGDQEGIELGREAFPVEEGHSSMMPWNIGSSLPGSRQGSTRGQGGSSMIGGFRTSGPSSIGGFEMGFAGSRGSFSRGLTRRGSRLPSASPLLGRGRHGGLERLSSLELPEIDPEVEGDLTLGGPEPMDLDLNEAQRGFELEMPVATQSQWLAETLDNESFNFLDFVKEKLRNTREATHDEEEDELSEDFRPPGVNHVAFDELLPPAEHTKVVAAQALLHTLSLATRNLISLRQDTGYGEIRISIIGNN